ncbi:MAG TPA: hypothetical protein VMF50_07390 [Candidatus Binataceae bacterium]|nr:hypothetical protein [Candidatus Binataceae bacterium]
MSGNDDAQGSSGLRPVRPDEVLSANEIARLLEHLSICATKIFPSPLEGLDARIVGAGRFRH